VKAVFLNESEIHLTFRNLMEPFVMFNRFISISRNTSYLLKERLFSEWKTVPELFSKYVVVIERCRPVCYLARKGKTKNILAASGSCASANERNDQFK
jgi:hypothetical protein